MGSDYRAELDLDALLDEPIILSRMGTLHPALLGEEPMRDTSRRHL